MSSDIVSRLRDSQFGGRSLCQEAANEIERLRTVIQESEIAKPHWIRKHILRKSENK